MTKVIKSNEQEFDCKKTVDEIIGIKMKYQGKEYARLEAEFTVGYREMNIKARLTPEETEYVMKQPRSEFCGSQSAADRAVWVYYDQDTKKVFRGSGCGASGDGSISGF